jgi:tetratricopeptide (TPR) repeat protein
LRAKGAPDSSGRFDEARAAALCQHLLDVGRYEEAVQVASEMLAPGESATALALLSLALRRLRRYEEALSAAQRATAIQPDHLGAWTALALANSALGAHTAAIAAAEVRVRLAPFDSYGHILKSEMIDAWWPAPEGLAAAEEAVRLDPNSARAHRALGNAYLRRRSRSRARSSLQRALWLDSQAPGPRMGLAALDMPTRPGSAASDLLDVARGHPREPLVTYNLRVALARILAGTWYLVLVGALLSLAIVVASTEFGLPPVIGTLIRVMLATAVVVAVLLLCGRTLRLERARRALRFALAADRSLVVLGTVLLVGLTGLLVLALVPPAVEGVVLFLLYPALWAVSTVASLVWRVKIDADERRL